MRKYEPRLATDGRVLLRVPAELVRAQLRLVVAVRSTVRAFEPMLCGQSRINLV